MDKKSLIGLGLIAVILITWLSLSGPSKEQIARNKQIKDSIELATKQTQEADRLKQMAAQKDQAVQKAEIAQLSDSAKLAIASQKYKDFSVSVAGKAETFTIENENLKAYISAKGGKVEKVELKNYHRYGKSNPLVLFDKDSTSQYLRFEAYGNTKFVTDSFYFKALEPAITVTGSASKSLVVKLETAKPGSYIEYVYTLKGNDYMLGYDVNFVGMQDIIAKDKITLHWSQAMPSQEQHITKEREVATVYYKPSADDADYINARKSEEKFFAEEETNMKWVSFKQHFFNSTLIADQEFLKDGSWIKTSENPKSEFVKTITSELTIPYKHTANEKFAMKYYFGPNHYNTLKQYDLDLEKIIPTGWSVFSYINKWMVIPLFNVFSGLNAGLIILILTLILKTLLFPIAYK